MMVAGSEAVEAWTNFADAVVAIKREFNRYLKKYDLSLIEFRIMSKLETDGPSSMARLADDLLITKAGTTLLTDRLEERGLIRRKRMREDRRLIFVELTPAGRRKVASARGVHDRFIVRKLSNLTAEEMERLVELVRKLTDEHS